MQKIKFAKVVVGLPVEGPFDYYVPSGFWQTNLRKGFRVKVPFRNYTLTGYVVDTSRISKITKIKPILEVPDKEPIIDLKLLSLTKHVSDYYLCSWGQAIEAALPEYLIKGRKMTQGPPSKNHNGGFLKDYEEKVDSQLKPIIKALDSNRFKLFIMHYKQSQLRWEIFFEIIKKNHQRNRQAIILVPDLDYAKRILQLIRSRLSLRVGLSHSSLSDRQELNIWQAANTGEIDLIIGTRKAVFSPLKNLGVVIVDEEENTVYKQENPPHYNARDVAIMRGRTENFVVILASACPSLESYYLTRTKQARLIEVKEQSINLPQIQMVDMRREFSRVKKQKVIFSRVLLDQIKKQTQSGLKVALFFNRRGFGNVASCRNCGFSLRCPRCNLSLTYYYAKKILHCHYCNYRTDLPEICPQCKSSYIGFRGTGTEKIESELHRLFPNTNISRCDKDTDSFGSFDILVCTQLILKKIDTPIDFLGIISIDASLNRVDFRAAERTFSLLIRLNELAKSKVIIQTFQPQHYCFSALQNLDYKYFFKKELSLRKELNFPPFSHLVSINLRSKDEAKTKEAADFLFKALTKKKSEIEVSRPYPSIPFKLRGKFRMHVLFKAKELSPIHDLLKKTMPSFKKGSITVNIDVDPQF